MRSKISGSCQDMPIDEKLYWHIDGDVLLRGQLILMDALVANDWKRPICFTNPPDSASGLNLSKYFRTQGMVYELVPHPNSAEYNSLSYYQTCTNDLYNTIMHQYKWTGLISAKYEGHGIAFYVYNLKISLVQLAYKLISENKKDSAVKVLTMCTDSISENICPYRYGGIYISEAYYKAGATSKANTMAHKLFDIYTKQLMNLQAAGTAKTKTTLPSSQDYIVPPDSPDEAKTIIKSLISDAKTYSQQALYAYYKDNLKTLLRSGILSKEEYADMLK